MQRKDNKLYASEVLRERVKQRMAALSRDRSQRTVKDPLIQEIYDEFIEEIIDQCPEDVEVLDWLEYCWQTHRHPIKIYRICSKYFTMPSKGLWEESQKSEIKVGQIACVRYNIPNDTVDVSIEDMTWTVTPEIFKTNLRPYLRNIH